MDKMLYLNSLFDIYKDLLTVKQQTYFKDYYFNNLSLAEIADKYQVSRNAIFKQLKIIEDKLSFYEKKLKIYDKKLKINDIEHPESLVAPVVTFEDFILSLQKMKPTVSEADLKRQQEFTEEFGSEG